MKNNLSFPSLFYQTSVIMIVLIVLIAGSATSVSAQVAPSPLRKTIYESSAYGKFGPDTTIRLGKGATANAVGGGAVWVLYNDDGTVSRIDPNTNQVVAPANSAQRQLSGKRFCPNTQRPISGLLREQGQFGSLPTILESYCVSISNPMKWREQRPWA